jgi:hypothetical protein
MSYSNSFPQQRPTLNLDFANSGKLDSRISYSRSSTGTYLSNEKALNSENLLLDSKTGTGNWTRDRSGAALVPVITANHSASPDGTANQATRVQLDLNGSTTPSDYARYYQAHNVASGTSATFAVWMRSTDGASSYAAQILSPAGPGVAVSITGSWQKFTVTADSSGNITYGVRLRGGQTPTNADTADILIWGANLSTIGQTVLSETTSQIHREYSPLLKTAAADAARFEYAADGQSDAGSPLGLLIESSASNLLPYGHNGYNSSNNFSMTLVDLIASQNAAVSPSGLLDATLLTDTGGLTQHRFDTGISGLDSSKKYTLSGYFKATGTTTSMSLRISSGNTYGAEFNFSTGYVGTYGAAPESYTFAPVGNGWIRVSITARLVGGSTASLRINTNLGDVQSDDYSGMLIYGLQFEEGSSPSSVLLTSGSALTRASDSCSVATADFGFTGGPVSVYADANAGAGSYPCVFALYPGATSSSSIRVFRNLPSSTEQTDFRFNVKLNTVSEVLLTPAGSGAVSKFAIRADTNSFAVKSSGLTQQSDTSCAMPVPDTLEIGGGPSVGQLNGTIRNLMLWNVAISDTELSALVD